ncbi:MAG: deoxyribose-phosphate aldolase [Bryobacterales bacterium]|nr:deoxyribose-phosphate aldolase [Bryobacterales bacterium]
MTQAELDRLVGQIGEEILARINRPALSRVEGLNQPESVCPGCVQRCPQTCAKKTAEIVAAGADRVSASEKLTRVDPGIAGLIDHTLLRPNATRTEIVTLCAEARKFGFASVCVNPYWVNLAAAELAGSGVAVCTVTGFPLGATTTAAKLAETETALRAGATEIDMVQNVGALLSGDQEAVRLDIAAVVRLAHAAGASVKVILETAFLDDAQKAAACALAKMAKADFVKTSTGFGPHGATTHDVRLMRHIVGPAMGVKAAGGIRTLDDFRAMAAAGASRIGASASVRIMEAAGSAR